MRSFACAFFIILSAVAFGQPKFKQAYQSSFPLKVDSRFSSPDKTIVYGWSEREMAAMSTETGKQLWKHEFAKDYGYKVIDYFKYCDYSEVIVLYSKDSKKEACHKICVDARTGETLWKSDDYGTTDELGPGLGSNFCELGVFEGTVNGKTNFYNLRDGKLNTDVTYVGSAADSKMIYFDGVKLEAQDMLIEMTYEDKMRAAGSFLNSKSDIEVTAMKLSTKQVLWRTRFEADLQAQLCYNATHMGIWYGAVYNDVVLAWEVLEDQVLVYYDGITAIDANTGKIQWNSTYNTSDISVGLSATQTHNIAALPLVSDNAVYIVDLTKNVNIIKKLDRRTGRELWRTEELAGNDIVPSMYVSGNYLVCQFGGELPQQVYIDNICNTKIVSRGNFGIRAYDVNTGKEVWNTRDFRKELEDDFKDKISNMLFADGKVFAAGKDALEVLDVKTGKQLYYSDVKKMKIGEPVGMTWQEGNILLRAEKGVALINASNGATIFVTKISDYKGEFWEGDNLFVWVDADKYRCTDFVGIDVKTGNLLGLQKDTSYPQFAPNGSFFIKYDGSKFYRFNVF
ncbi:PQQ-binding-like beta-propeller repeat protein [bacterium]|nr:PQQ-binding-like beta-propeller repeat protein [bacterium]